MNQQDMKKVLSPKQIALYNKYGTEMIMATPYLKKMYFEQSDKTTGIAHLLEKQTENLAVVENFNKAQQNKQSQDKLSVFKDTEASQGM